ncbi:MAG: porin [Thermodesulfobacteriota bacterium]
MINLHKILLKSVCAVFLIMSTSVMAQGDVNESGEQSDEYFFDVDAVKFEAPRLLRPEFHGNISLGAPFAEGLDESEKNSSDVSKQTEITLWTGVQIFKNLSFVTELEIEDGFERYELERFALDWKIFNDRCVFRIGKFYYPFGIERLVENAVNNKLIDRPNPSIKIIPGTYSDEGLELYGNGPFFYKTRLKYEFAATNGLSSFEGKGEQHLDDNNDNISLGGRLGIELFPGLEIGGSYSTGKYDDDEKLRMDFIGADASYKKGGFEMRGEYIRSNVERTTSAGGSFDREGYYIQASYKYLPEINYVKHVEFVGRFDSVDPDDLTTDENDAERMAVGINCSLTHHFILKLEYEMEDEANDDIEKKGFIQMNIRW